MLNIISTIFVILCILGGLVLMIHYDDDRAIPYILIGILIALGSMFSVIKERHDLIEQQNYTINK